MIRWFDVVESRHELQNPTSFEKIRLLGERMRLGPSMEMLDMGSGRGGPAVALAKEFGCRITCVERSEEFVTAARRRAAEAGVEELLQFTVGDGRDIPLPKQKFDAAVCLGASFIWGGLTSTVTALSETVRPGGFVAVGEVFWRIWPLPDSFQPDEGWDFAPLGETVERFETAGVHLVTLIASSRDEWDAYESLHWLTLDQWLQDNPHDSEAERFREIGRDERDAYLRWQRDLLGWAIFVGRKQEP